LLNHLLLDQQKAMNTLKLIHKLKRAINPKTGVGFTYSDIGRVLGVSKQAVSQQVKSTTGLCCGCLRKLDRVKVDL